MKNYAVRTPTYMFIFGGIVRNPYSPLRYIFTIFNVGIVSESIA